MKISTDLGIWVSVFCTLGIMSFLYKDNKWYSAIENAFVGAAAAHALVLGWENIRDLAVRPMTLKGDMAPVIPVLLGLMLYLRFIKPAAWVSRIPMGFLYGLGAGVAIRGVVMSQVFTQLTATAVKIKSVNDVVIVVGVITTMCYFLFSYRPTASLGRVQTLGRWFMMITFGASFGNTVMDRVSVVISRLTFLFHDWLGLMG